MATLRFPFWMVTQRRGLICKPVEPAGTPGYIAVFSSAERAAAYMVCRGETEWENRLVSRPGLEVMMADLRQLGVCGLCLDPERAGGGTAIPFENLAAQSCSGAERGEREKRSPPPDDDIASQRRALA